MLLARVTWQAWRNAAVLRQHSAWAQPEGWAWLPAWRIPPAPGLGSVPCRQPGHGQPQQGCCQHPAWQSDTAGCQSQRLPVRWLLPRLRYEVQMELQPLLPAPAVQLHGCPTVRRLQSWGSAVQRPPLLPPPLPPWAGCLPAAPRSQKHLVLLLEWGCCLR